MTKPIKRVARRCLSALLAMTFLAAYPAVAQAKRDYTLFEVGAVRPVVSLSKSGAVAVLNIADDHLELFKPGDTGVTHCASIKVGMRPVAVAAVSETRTSATLWVVNQLSDSVSIVSLNLQTCTGGIVNTLQVGDEPKDIVVANTPAGKRVFISMAHRGQNHPDPLTRSGDDLIRSGAENQRLNRPDGLADVVTYDPGQLNSPQITTLFTYSPRALALGPVDNNGFHHQVFAAGFNTGNQTTAVSGKRVAGVGVAYLRELIANGEITESDDGRLMPQRDNIKMRGGSPAIKGFGRCLPDPREDRYRWNSLQLCAQTDAQNNLLAFVSQAEGQVNNSCSCSNSSGELQPVIGIIAKFFAEPELCGNAFDQDIGGCWLDQDPTQNAKNLPAVDWNSSIKLILPDKDVFELNISDEGSVTQNKSHQGVGNTLYAMTVHPRSGQLYVLNQDVNNMIRFEGNGTFAGTSVRGKMVKSRITVIDSQPPHQQHNKNLNDHLNSLSSDQHAQGDIIRKSLSIATAIAISHQKNAEGQFSTEQTLYFTAQGTDHLAYVSSSALEGAADGEVNQQVKKLKLSQFTDAGGQIIAGPAGLDLDEVRQRLYLLARFTNELIVVDISGADAQILQRHEMFNPEPESVTAGRAVLYYSPAISANGDQSCASCHPVSGTDDTIWNLGNPDAQSVNMPGPFVSSPVLGFLEDLAIDPEEKSPRYATVKTVFATNKGPMLTQPLKGLANHGPMHWRGDRVRRVQLGRGVQPDENTLDEANSIREFDEAVTGLLGADEPLSDEKIDQLADYVMQISYPPNPLRQLDNGLDKEQLAGRAAFFGCKSLSDEQLDARQCTGLNDKTVEIDSATSDCRCVSNPIRIVMKRLTDIQPFAQSFSQIAFDSANLTETDQQRYQLLLEQANTIKALQRQPLSAYAVAGNQAVNNHLAFVYSEAQLALIREWVGGPQHPAQTGGMLQWIVDKPDFMPSSAPGQLTAQLQQFFGDANVSRRALLDAQLPPGKEQGPLHQCGLDYTEQQCPLRVMDAITTCQGCHVLDKRGNSEFGVDFPGFFGTKGEYAFSNFPIMLKPPQLRNVYTKAGKFGHPHISDSMISQSIFGSRRGGFFDRSPPVVGPSVRGVGYGHDGSSDSAHRFAGFAAFLKRGPGRLGPNDIRGNPTGIDAFTPDDPAACLAKVTTQGGSLVELLEADLEQLTQATMALLQGDKTAAAQVVETVLASPAIQTDARWQVITASARNALNRQQPLNEDIIAPILDATLSSLLCPDAANRSEQLLPLCYQLGSTLEMGDAEGVCFPTGQKERAAVESYLLRFDSNLSPMVGQQLTVSNWLLKRIRHQRLTQLVSAAAAGQCDIGAWDDTGGYLMTSANPAQPMQSQLLGAGNITLSVGKLLKINQRIKGYRLTFTCYPPQQDQAEARRSVLERFRHSGSEPNGT